MIPRADDDIDLLTPELKAAAVQIGREPAWKPAVARTVIKHLADHGVAVLGIEVLVPVEDGYTIGDYSGYELPCGGEWAVFVEQNAKEPPSNALIILTWVDREEHDRLHS